MSFGSVDLLRSLPRGEQSFDDSAAPHFPPSCQTPPRHRASARFSVLGSDTAAKPMKDFLTNQDMAEIVDATRRKQILM
ncbi:MULTISPECIES: hypothetical protein [unclassified Mesorhizobium]|uniref:hypothetical protein n=1 Tax=unclassified Mesorhizobium TaxID=325217 RepID=UPI00333A798B